MRFVDDEGLSFCVTISAEIKRDDLLAILGRVDTLPVLFQTFDDTDHSTYQPGRNGIINVFEEGDLLITVEKHGFLGVALRTIRQVAALGDAGHYLSFCCSTGDDGYYQYTEVVDGQIVANFDPQLDEAPEVVADFFLGSANPRRVMIQAAERRMRTTIKSVWLEQPTDTYIIDYRTDRN